MKAILAAVFAVLIGVAFSTTTFAQAPSATDKPAAPEMKKDNGKKGEKKEMKKEKIDERLVWNARFCSQSVEVPDRFLVKPDRDLTLQSARIGIPPSFRKIVFFSHGANHR